MYEACDLAGCSRRYNPHAVRKAFGTYLSKKGISKEDRKLILDHAEGRGSDVTEVNYNFDPKLDDKQKTMEIWNTFLDDCIRLARKSLEPELRKDVGSADSAADEITKDVDLTLPKHIPQPEHGTMVRAIKSSGASRATDPERLENLRAKLDARKKLDEALERTLRKHSLS